MMSAGRCRFAGAARVVTAIVLVCAGPAPPAGALEVQKGEQQAIDACDRRLCSILVGKSTKGDDLKCALTKTWSRSTLKEGDSGSVIWSFGDARCSVDLNVSRAAIVAAVTDGKPHKFWLPSHTAKCIIEQDGRLDTLKATVAPKIIFKNGKAEKIWINLREVDGPPGLRDWLTTSATLADKLGIFHRAMIKSVNRYIDRHCGKLAPQAEAGKGPNK